MSAYQLQVIQHPDGRKFLYLDSKHMEACLQAFKEGGYYAVGVSRYHGYEADDLEILKEIPTIRGIHIQDSIADMKGLANVKNIQYLLINGLSHDLVLSMFGNLEELRITAWSQRYKNLGKCSTLKTLYLYSYGPHSKDLSELAGLSRLESLQLVKGSISSLQGVESLRALREIILRYLPKLEYLSPVSGSKAVQRVELDHCKNIRDLHVLAELPKLSNLAVNGCGEIPSVDFIKQFKALRRCSFVETNIVDGNLNPFLELPGLEYVGFLKKRHYTHTPEELNALLKGGKQRA